MQNTRSFPVPTLVTNRYVKLIPQMSLRKTFLLIFNDILLGSTTPSSSDIPSTSSEYSSDSTSSETPITSSEQTSDSTSSYTSESPSSDSEQSWISSSEYYSTESSESSSSSDIQSSSEASRCVVGCPFPLVQEPTYCSCKCPDTYFCKYGVYTDPASNCKVCNLLPIPSPTGMLSIY
jgi:hypothetical protein